MCSGGSDGYLPSCHDSYARALCIATSSIRNNSAKSRERGYAAKFAGKEEQDG